MALITSILTGGTNNHETTSEEANTWATDFVSEGIANTTLGNTGGVAPMTGGFNVNAQGTPDMTVAVASGVCYVQATPTSQASQMFRVYNNASSNVTISANSSGSTKYDWLYVKLDATNLNTPNTAGDNAASLVTSRSSSASSDDGTPPTYGYPIAVITVANGATTITNSVIRDIRGQATLNTGSSVASSWTSLGYTPNTITYNGNRSYSLVINSADLTGTVSNGMRLKLTRTVTAPTQCTDLEASSSQYFSRASASLTGVSFTDDFCVTAWVKLESYAAMTIISRFDGNTGWQLVVDSSGRVTLGGYNGSGGNNNSIVISYESLPLGKWVHVAAQLDMSAFTATSTTSYIMFNGVDIPVSVSRGGTNPTSLVQAGDLNVGRLATSGTQYFDGKLAQVAVFSAKVTQATMRTYMSQGLSGSETNLVSAYSLSNSLNDLNTSNANNLTAQNSAAATNADSPFGQQADGTTAGTTEYAIVTKTAFSTNTTLTVQVPEGCAIPTSGGVSAVSYSTQAVPYGFPKQQAKWLVNSVWRVQTITTSNANFGSLSSNGWALTVPVGEWAVGYEAGLFNSAAAGAVVTFSMSPTSLVGVALGSEDIRFSSRVEGDGSGGNMRNNVHLSNEISNSASSTYVMYSQGATTSAGVDGDNSHCEMFAKLALL